jgi:diguanylate cyclase (GGDEF)-like protein/PAS domain S-box-containing protein
MGRMSSPLIRISLGLVALTTSILLGLDLLGFVPHPADTELDGRVQQAQTLASHAASAIERSQLEIARSVLEMSVRSDEELLSAGLRAEDGHLLMATRDHRELWKPKDPDRSSSTHIQLPMYRGGRPWARLEVRYAQLDGGGPFMALWRQPVMRLTLLLGGAGFVAYLLYMRRMLRHLDPSSVIPARVQAAMDVMAEGVLVIAQDGQIVLANTAIAAVLEREPGSLMGTSVDALPWRALANGGDEAPAWVEAIRSSEAVIARPTLLETAAGQVRSLVVNAAPVLDGWGRAKGAIATFDDVTELEQSRTRLEQALGELEKSRDEIRLQNEELQIMARRDPLTGVANRRAFMSQFEGLFEEAAREGRKLSCVMADVDHFKSVNDSHGHAAGDEVIRRIAEGLVAEAPTPDLVCRYGGEEFCVGLPDLSLDEAAALADRVRRRVEAPGFTRVPVTLSFGVSAVGLGADDAAGLIDQADEALYVSKGAGRNRVTRFRSAAGR